MRNATMVSLEKSLDISITILETDAPSILRMQTSFVRCSAVNAARPNNPRHEMKIARPVKVQERLLMRLMLENLVANSSSAKRYHNGCSGSYFLKIASTVLTDA